MCGGVQEVITGNIFHQNRARGFRVTRRPTGPEIGYSHWLGLSPVKQSSTTVLPVRRHQGLQGHVPIFTRGQNQYPRLTQIPWVQGQLGVKLHRLTALISHWPSTGLLDFYQQFYVPVHSLVELQSACTEISQCKSKNSFFSGFRLCHSQEK